MVAVSVLAFAVVSSGRTRSTFRPAAAAPPIGRFDLDVQKSNVFKVGKSHVGGVSAFVTYTNEFFGGTRKALEVQLFA